MITLEINQSNYALGAMQLRDKDSNKRWNGLKEYDLFDIIYYVFIKGI